MKKLLSKKWQREHGVALLMTLAILAMLMILAMSFAFTSTHEKQAAVIHSDVIRARLLTESAINRAISVIRNDIGTAYPATNGFYPVQSGDNEGRYIIGTVDSSDTETDTTVAQSLATKIDGQTFFYDYTQNITAPDDDLFAEKMEWQNVYNGTASDPIIGRFAYIIIDESGKLAIDAYIDASLIEEPTARHGFFDTEVYLGYALPTANTLDNTRIDELRTTRPTTNRWLSWSNLLRTDLFPIDNETKRKEAFKSILPHGYDIEAFYVTSDTDYHRFNLGLGDDFWRHATVDSLLTANKPFWSGNGVNSDSIGGIHWLSNSAAPLSQREQIAANIIDYSDAGLEGETDYDGSDISTASYFGNEMAPYLNEIHFRFIKTGPPGPNTEADINIEVINIYNTSFTNVRVELDVIFHENGNSTTEQTFSWTFDSPAENYATGPTYRTYEVSNGNASSIIGVERIVGRVYLDTGELVDLIYLEPDDENHFAAAGPASDGTFATVDSTNDHYEMRFQVHDPRLNLSNIGATDENWDLEIFPPSTAPALISLGGRNNIGGTDVDATAGNDLETVGDPAAGLSTAYVRDGPMRSLWELGAIHRGAKWETINLHTYTDGLDRFSATYSDGDAGMLEYVKVSNRAVHGGGFNINSVYDDAWKSILHDVQVKGEYSDPIDTTSALGESLQNIIDAIQAAKPAAQFTNRGGIMLASQLSEDAQQETDSEQEEIIGKIAHLLSVRPNYFTVIAVSQSLRDLNLDEDIASEKAIIDNLKLQYGSDDIIEYDKTENLYAHILSEHATLVVVYRDAFTNQIRIVHTEELY